MKRCAITLILVLAVGMAFSAPAYAQAKKGDREFLAFGNFFTILASGSTVATGMVFLNVGKFVTDFDEFGGGPTVSVTSGGGDTTAQVGFNVFGRRYFRTRNPKLAPYVGADLMVTSVKEFTDTMFASGTFGVKNYLTERAAIDAKVSVGFLPKHPADVQMVSFTIGLTYIF